MEKVIYRVNENKIFTKIGKVIGEEGQFLIFEDRYDGKIMIPICNIVEIQEAD